MVGLQLPIDGIGPSELLLIGLVQIVPFAIALGIAYWVYTDAERRGNDDAVLWALVVGGFTWELFPVGLLVPAVYVWQRD